jgi:hypothetical protein
MSHDAPAAAWASIRWMSVLSNTFTNVLKETPGLDRLRSAFRGSQSNRSLKSQASSL